MTAKEFYELNKGKYFMYRGIKVRVVGYNDYNINALIVSISKGTGMECITAQEFVNRELVSDKDLFRYVFINELECIGEKINLCEILKGCEGVELWSDIFGKCKLERLDYHSDFEIAVSALNTDYPYNKYEQFTKYGRFYARYPDGKCMLWPSETNRDWSTFKKPIKEGIPCMCKNADSDIWVLRTERQASYTYCVPVENFDFNDIESNTSRSIV